MTKTEELVIALLDEEFGTYVDFEKVNSCTDLADLGFDSLDAVEAIMAIEEEFDLEIDDEEAEDWTKISDVAAYIDKVHGTEG